MNCGTIARENIAEGVLSVQDMKLDAGSWVTVDFIDESVRVLANVRGKIDDGTMRGCPA